MKPVPTSKRLWDSSPTTSQAHYNLGIVLAGRGQFDAAIDHYQKALEIKPDYAQAHYNLGIVLAGRGQSDEAIAHYQKALEIKPDFVEAYYNLGTVLAGREQFDAAIDRFRKAVEIKADYTDARRMLEIVQSRWEEIRKALAGRRELLRSRPDDVALLSDIAWMLATNPNASIRNGTEAVELAQRAEQLSQGREPAILGTLAAAYAETARFPDAVQTARKALELATQQNNRSLAESIKTKLPLYEAGTPFRDMQQPSAAGSIRP